MKNIFIILLTVALCFTTVAFAVNYEKLDLFNKENETDDIGDDNPNDSTDKPNGDDSTDQPTLEDPTDQPPHGFPEEESDWVKVELTDITNSHSIPFGSVYPTVEKVDKFHVDEAGIYCIITPYPSEFISLVHEISGDMIANNFEPGKCFNLNAGDYAIGRNSDVNVEVYRYSGDYSFGLVELVSVDEGGFFALSDAADYSVIKIEVDQPITITSLTVKVGNPATPSVELPVVHNDGNGGLYLLSSLNGVLFITPSDIGNGISSFKAYGVLFNADDFLIDKGVVAPLAMTMSMRSMEMYETMNVSVPSVSEDVLEVPEGMMENETVLFDQSGFDEIVELPDGRSFVNGEEVIWSPVYIIE